MNVFRLLRPSHWIKNLLVFAPLFFGGALHDAGKGGLAFAAFCAFCLVAGGGYAWNDALDGTEDAAHPEKKSRPVAKGRISPARAGAVGFAAVSAGMAAAAAYAPAALPAIGAYAALSAAYSLQAKRVPVVELLFFPAFYLARIFAGGAATGIAISNWLVLCVVFISLFFVTVKRTAEKSAMYSERFLGRMTVIFGASALMSYGLYSVLGARSPYATYSVIFPIAGVMRYLMLAEREGNGAFPERLMTGDPFIFAVIAGWGAYVYALLY